MRSMTRAEPQCRSFQESSLRGRFSSSKDANQVISQDPAPSVDRLRHVIDVALAVAPGA